MNEPEIIEMALQRRFARVTIPDCPHGPWAPTSPAPIPRRARLRGFAYACAAVAILLGTGVATQAASALRVGYAIFFNHGSSTPLPPLIHQPDRLTIEQAQQHLPFRIVVPVGLPTHTLFQYAGVINVHSNPVVALYYQAQIAGRYFRIIIKEATAINGPPVVHFDAVVRGKDGQLRDNRWTLPVRRWRHGNVIMEMLPQGLPAAVVNRIVRDNTL